MLKHATGVLTLSGIGVLLSHETAYRIVAPVESQRQHLLEETGHAWYSLMPLIGLTLGVLLAGVSFLVAANKMRTPKLWELIAIQTGAYFFVESFERAASGSSPWPGIGLIVAGLTVQVPAAVFVYMVFNYVLVRIAETFKEKVLTPYFNLKDNPQPWEISSLSLLNYYLFSLTRRGPPQAQALS